MSVHATFEPRIKAPNPLSRRSLGHREARVIQITTIYNQDDKESKISECTTT